MRGTANICRLLLFRKAFTPLIIITHSGCSCGRKLQLRVTFTCRDAFPSLSNKQTSSLQAKHLQTTASQRGPFACPINGNTGRSINYKLSLKNQNKSSFPPFACGMRWEWDDRHAVQCGYSSRARDSNLFEVSAKRHLLSVDKNGALLWQPDLPECSRGTQRREELIRCGAFDRIS